MNRPAVTDEQLTQRRPAGIAGIRLSNEQNCGWVVDLKPFTDQIKANLPGQPNVMMVGVGVFDTWSGEFREAQRPANAVVR